ncbi:MAG: hypothetical protein CMK44_07835 [Porticoccus sp.]|jgi:putative lipoic acid-binding regulatory protein|nr:hypothetical protein [Porticoccus sp.]|tara:strand:+ start:82 stop:402 length:321 start_codon:yes stop_codon:yes gene_type:complete
MDYQKNSWLTSLDNRRIDDTKKIPKIEYPCEYPIKVIGKSGPDLYALIIRVMEAYSPGFERSKIKIKNSKNGTFQAITVVIIATGPDQIQSLFGDLKINPLVKIVL